MFRAENRFDHLDALKYPPLGACGVPYAATSPYALPHLATASRTTSPLSWHPLGW
jgi:hypothetical protein